MVLPNEMPPVDIATTGRCVIWFSCGAASTVAAKIALTERPDALVCYIDTGSEHEDTERYRSDVARWLNRPIQVLRSPDYVDVDDVIERTRYIVGVHGARCTTELKIKVRRAFQQPDDVQVFGFDARPKEVKRAIEFRENYPEVNLWTPLIDSGLDKSDCHQLVARAGIRQHAMYELGYKNANCIGCVKGSLGYWNKIRVDFPEVFARRARQEREIGHAICSTEVRINGRRDKIPVFLDELEPGRGNYAAEVEHECGVFCAGVEATWTDEEEACDV